MTPMAGVRVTLTINGDISLSETVLKENGRVIVRRIHKKLLS